MTFNSIHFLLFFPLVCALYFNLPKKVSWILLLLASCFFYGFFIPKYLLILFLLIGIDYTAGLYIETSRGLRRKFFLWLSLGSNLLLLGSFKYFNFFSDNLAAAFAYLGHPTALPKTDWILPIGLSFHTFQSMSYTIEVYRGNVRAERHLGIYALYVLFFPQLVAGPIERPQHLLEQFRKKPAFDPKRATAGLKLVLLGMVKKVVIADGLALYASEVFNNPAKYAGAPVLLAMLCFSIQIFCDFSGYTDIARGSARLLGIDLMENFNRPYLASSVAEFWRRWHISLSSWFRDYVYLPLGGNRCSRLRQIINVYAVFALSGLWHGASWNFVVWGLIHGTLVALGLFVRINSRILTFVFVTLAWVFFRAPNWNGAIRMFTQVISTDPKAYHAAGAPAIYAHADVLSFRMAVAGAIILVLSQLYAERRAGLYEDTLNAMKPWLRFSIYALQSLAILNAGSIYPVPFIYFQF